MNIGNRLRAQLERQGCLEAEMGSFGAHTRQGLANGGGKKAAVSDPEIRGSQATNSPVSRGWGT